MSDTASSIIRREKKPLHFRSKIVEKMKPVFVSQLELAYSLSMTRFSLKKRHNGLLKVIFLSL